ncbi:MAG TPA: UDP-2,3-diacylglucosamine diphosphatase [Puia sp.]|jgi:UDP-2,3-diacylglucosamine hydrolase|nr:UDP-2,3-diacylglucosamine diphosphatase [Puia sp.]
MQIEAGKKIYFLSDFHLGTPDRLASLQREKYIIQFLESIQHGAAEIFIVGDLFDFWFEYKTVVPKGYVRILGKLATLTDAGIPVQFFVGNHDMWMKNYFEKELSIPVYYEPKTFIRNNKKFLIGHGDGLGPGDGGYKFLKKIFRNKFSQSLFGILPPAVGVGIANYFSRKSRIATYQMDKKFLGEENEWLIQYCKRKLSKEHFDYMIFGHRHLPIDFTFPKGEKYINLGDWINYFSYAAFDGEQLELRSFDPSLDNKIIRL